MDPNGPKTTKVDIKELIHLYQNSFNTAYLDGGLSFYYIAFTDEQS